MLKAPIFVITILKNASLKTGWNVRARVQLKMHERDRALIQLIQNFFGGKGYISKPNGYGRVYCYKNWSYS